MIEVRRDDPRASHVAGLLAEHLADMRRSTPPGFSFALGVEALAAPSIAFWTAWTDGALVGFAALRELNRGHGEVKSMRAARLGIGVGRVLLDVIVAAARRRGYRRLSLETGVTDQFRAATALYKRAGFVDAEPFGDYEASPHNRFMSLVL